jgi:trans-aconitate methyltransferase
MVKPIRPWFKFDGREGDRTLDQQMLGLGLLMRSVKNATVLDVGCAEGLITIEMAKVGATALHGIEIRPQAVTDANALRGDLPITFEQGDMNSWLPQRNYDVVVMLAILHKLKDPLTVLDKLLYRCRDLAVLRLPPRSDNPVVHDARSGSKRINLKSAFTSNGFTQIHWTPGYLDEWVGYYRRTG